MQTTKGCVCCSKLFGFFQIGHDAHVRRRRHWLQSVRLCFALCLRRVYFCLRPFRDPVKLLVLSMLFICAVFLLHIWGRISRSF